MESAELLQANIADMLGGQIQKFLFPQDIKIEVLVKILTVKRSPQCHE